ncbi:MAG: hypothetical protein M9894_13670 [Planctomycetes bacterium]|nr:hypothetical protein [Planctomycetota bacterium]
MGRPIYYAYDQVGNLLTSDDTAAGLGVSEFEYDAMDRLVEKTTVAGVVAYEYDLSGMKTRVTDPNSEATTHAYDEAGRLIRATVLDTPNRENDFHHDRSGLIERKVLAGNKVVSYYAYDVAGRLSSLVNRDDAAAVISSFVYQRNPNGAVTQVEHEDGEFTYYAYDALDRLIEERRVQNPTVYGFAYQYDAASNRVQKVDLVEDETTNYTVDARNLIQSEVTGADEIAYEYDQAQRMKRRASAEEATVFSHNQRDLPTKVEFESETPEATREFKYNGTGERVAIVGELGPGYETRLAYDGTRLLTEKDEFDNTFGRYRWGSPQHGGALVESSNPAEAGPEEGPVMDERGSVDRLVGVSGRVIYDRFGVELAGSLSSSTRTRFVSPVFLRLGTSERLSVTWRGVVLHDLGRASAPLSRLRGWMLGGPVNASYAEPPFVQEGGVPFESEGDRDDPRDEPPPVIYWEEIQDGPPACGRPDPLSRVNVVQGIAFEATSTFTQAEINAARGAEFLALPGSVKQRPQIEFRALLRQQARPATRDFVWKQFVRGYVWIARIQGGQIRGEEKTREFRGPTNKVTDNRRSQPLPQAEGANTNSPWTFDDVKRLGHFTTTWGNRSVEMKDAPKLEGILINPDGRDYFDADFEFRSYLVCPKDSLIAFARCTWRTRLRGELFTYSRTGDEPQCEALSPELDLLGGGDPELTLPPTPIQRTQDFFGPIWPQQ